MSRYPRITLTGTHYARGLEHGRQARERVHRSRAGYEATFAQAAGLSWAEACELASVMEEPIREAFPDLLEEMRGIADGAGLAFADILTMNCRTEIMWAEEAKTAVTDRLNVVRECTAFGLEPQRTANGHVLMGQNWDWLVQGTETVVVLEVEQSDAPNYVTVVEAGLLAKTGMNSSGLAVAALALVSTHDKCAPGIPFHVLLRALMDCETLSEAEALIYHRVRASSANYLLGYSDGGMINFETAPGDFTMVSRQLPNEGVLIHSNHFLEPPGDAKDLAGLSMEDSFMRYHQMTQGMGDKSSQHSLGSLRKIMSDHTEYPNSICCHPDPNDQPAEQWCTAASVVFDLTARRVYLAEGNPCEYEYEELELDESFIRPAEASR